MHNQQPVSRFLVLAVIGLLALGLAGLVQIQAQGQNLLQNPGFEGTYIPFSGNSTQQVAPGWSAWNIPHKSGDPEWLNITPQYRPAANNKRIHGGGSAQEFFEVFATFTGGVFQRVAVTPGSTVRFSAFVNVWSTSLDDPNASEQPGNVHVRVGIDPTGGTNGSGSAIAWMPAQQFYDQYQELTIATTATSNFVTVFVEGAPSDPVKNNDVYVDDASLVITSGPAPTIAPPTNAPPTIAPPTGQFQPTQEGTVVVVTTGPTATPNPFQPTQEGTTTPQAETPIGPTSVFPTPIPFATSTPAFTSTVTYTVEPGDTVSGIAQRFNSDPDAIINANNLDSSGLIYPGQQLTIPIPATPVPQPSAVPTAVTGGVAPVDTAILTGPTVNGIGTYIVQPGDDLNHIARHYGLTLEALAQLNGIVNPSQVSLGQVLVVPGPGNNVPGGSVPPTVIPTAPGATARTHTVAAGENLFRISLRYGVTLDALMRANGIVNPNLIYVGQVLRIP